jgi:ribosomal protein L11 methyltransferase
MEWKKVEIGVKGQGSEVKERICGILSVFGIDDLEIVGPPDILNMGDMGDWDYLDEELLNHDKSLIRFYLPSDDKRFNLGEIAHAIGDLGVLTTQIVKDDWSHAWLEYYNPFKIGKHVVIRPYWEEYDPAPGEIVFTIDPGHVFGTGQHQSTALCIGLLENHVKGGESVLDIGAGSGILAIIARLLGTAHATAIDIDPAAAKSVARNAELNGISLQSLDILCGNVLNDPNLIQGHYQIIVANIVADVIIRLSSLAADVLTDKGKFIVSGIISERRANVESALIATGFKILEILEQDDWVAICAIKEC